MSQPILPGEVCADCDRPVTHRAVVAFASYGFCDDHGPRVLVDPSALRIATVECTSCKIALDHPTEAEEHEFAAAHIHGNATLQAWFDRRTGK